MEDNIDTTPNSELGGYLRDLAVEALRRDSLLFMPTVYTKRILSSFLIQDTVVNDRDLPSKRLVAFLCAQSSAMGLEVANISTYTDASVIEFNEVISAYEGKDTVYWKESEWESAFSFSDVIVMTADNFNAYLQTSFFRPEDFNLVIIDDCHLAQTSKSIIDMCKLLRSRIYKPKIVAISSSILSSKKESAFKQIDTIEKQLDCKLLFTVESLQKYKELVPTSSLSAFLYPSSSMKQIDCLRSPYIAFKDTPKILPFLDQVPILQKHASLMLYAYYRARCAILLASVYQSLEEIKIEVETVSEIKQFVLPSYELYKQYRACGSTIVLSEPLLRELLSFSPAVHKLNSPDTINSNIIKLPSALCKVMQITEECGVLSGLYAFVKVLGVSNYSSLTSSTHEDQFYYRPKPFLQSSFPKYSMTVTSLPELNQNLDDLKYAPFPLIDIVHEEYVICVSILDYFLCFATRFDIQIIERAAQSFLSHHQLNTSASRIANHLLVSIKGPNGQERLTLPKVYALPYLLMQAVIRSHVIMPFTAEGCLVLIEELWNDFIDQEQDLQSICLSYEDLRQSIQSASMFLLHSMRIDDLDMSLNANQKNAHSSTKIHAINIEPLYIDGDSMESSSSESETLNFEKFYYNSPEYSMISEKIKALIDVCNSCNEGWEEIRWHTQAKAMFDAFLEKIKLDLEEIFDPTSITKSNVVSYIGGEILACEQSQNDIIADFLHEDWTVEDNMMAALCSMSDAQISPVTDAEIISDESSHNSRDGPPLPLPVFVPPSRGSMTKSNTQFNGSSRSRLTSIQQNKHASVKIKGSKSSTSRSSTIVQLTMSEPAPKPKRIDFRTEFLREFPEVKPQTMLVVCESSLQALAIHFVINLCCQNDIGKKRNEHEIRGINIPSLQPYDFIRKYYSHCPSGSILSFQHQVIRMVYSPELFLEAEEYEDLKYVIHFESPSTLKAYALQTEFSMKHPATMISLIPCGKEGQRINATFGRLFTQKASLDQIVAVSKQELLPILPMLVGNLDESERALKQIEESMAMLSVDDYEETITLFTNTASQQLLTSIKNHQNNYFQPFRIDEHEDDDMDYFNWNEDDQRTQFDYLQDFHFITKQQDLIMWESKKAFKNEEVVINLTKQQQLQRKLIANNYIATFLTLAQRLKPHVYITRIRDVVRCDSLIFLCKHNRGLENNVMWLFSNTAVQHNHDASKDRLSVSASLCKHDLHAVVNRKKKRRGKGREGISSSSNGGENSADNSACEGNPVAITSFVVTKEDPANMKYIVLATGAEADAKSSNQILQKFCQQLPHDSFYTPRPIYWMSKVPVNGKNNFHYYCSILLPPYVLQSLRFIVGPVCTSKNNAKGLASLECIKLLHQKGELNDWLLTNGSKASEKVDAKLNVDQSFDNKSMSISSTPSNMSTLPPSFTSSGFILPPPLFAPLIMTPASSHLNTPIITPLATEKKTRKRKLSTIMSEDIKAESMQKDYRRFRLLNSPNLKDSYWRDRMDADGDLIEPDAVGIDCKIVPELLSNPAATIDTRQTTQSNNSTDKKPEQNDGKLLYFYVIQTDYADHRAEKVLTCCASCSQYFLAGNHFGIALPGPVPLDVLEESFRCFIREREPVDVSIDFLAEKIVHKCDLLHLQRFHKGLLCWETETVTDSIARTVFGDKDGWIHAQYEMSKHHPEISNRDPIPHEEWAASGNNAWYVLFPLPPLHDSLQKCMNCEKQTEGKITKAKKFVNHIQATKDVDTNIFYNPTLWSNYVEKCADEAQILSNNIRRQEILNREYPLDYAVPPVQPLSEEDMLGMLVSRGHGGIYVVLPDHVSYNEPHILSANYRYPLKDSILQQSFPEESTSVINTPLKLLSPSKLARATTPRRTNEPVRYIRHLNDITKYCQKELSEMEFIRKKVNNILRDMVNTVWYNSCSERSAQERSTSHRGYDRRHYYQTKPRSAPMSSNKRADNKNSLKVSSDVNASISSTVTNKEDNDPLILPDAVFGAPFEATEDNSILHDVMTSGDEGFPNFIASPTLLSPRHEPKDLMAVMREIRSPLDEDDDDDIFPSQDLIKDAIVQEAIIEQDNFSDEDLEVNEPSTPVMIIGRSRTRRRMESLVKENRLEDLVPVSFGDIFKRRYPKFGHVINKLASNPSHKLLRVVTVVNRLTLLCLSSKTLKITKENQLGYVPDNKPAKLHTHANPLYLLPEFTRPIGKSKWYLTGLIAPSIIWRVVGLIHSAEAREKIRSIIKTEHCACELYKARQEALQSKHPVRSISPSDDQLGNSAIEDVAEEVVVDAELIEQKVEQQLSELKLPPVQLMFEALTPRLAGESIDSERLEILGDSLLKLVTSVEIYRLFPDKHEGYLTVQRNKTISNLFLLESAYRLNIHHYLRAYSLSNGKQMLKIRPPGMEGYISLTEKRCLWNENIWVQRDYSEEIIAKYKAELQREKMGPHAKVISTINTTRNNKMLNIDLTLQPSLLPSYKFKTAKEYFSIVHYPNPKYAVAFVKPKILADVMEAIFGAFFVAGGINSGVAAIKAFGAWPQVDKDLGSAKVGFSTVQPPAQKSYIKSIADISSALTVNYVNRSIGPLDFPPNYPTPLKRIALGVAIAAGSEISQDVDILMEDADDGVSIGNFGSLSYSDTATAASLMTNPSSTAADGTNHEAMMLLQVYSKFEQTRSLKTNYHEDDLTFAYLPMPEIVKKLHTLMNYEFKNHLILQEALTHCSIPTHISNQRMEFLGDAVLDFAVLSMLFDYQPWATPGDLAIQKSNATNNRNLGLIGAKLGLYKYLRYASPLLEEEFRDIHQSVEKWKKSEERRKVMKFRSNRSMSPMDRERLEKKNLDSIIGAVVDLPSTPCVGIDVEGEVSDDEQHPSGYKRLRKESEDSWNASENSHTINAAFIDKSETNLHCESVRSKKSEKTVTFDMHSTSPVTTMETEQDTSSKEDSITIAVAVDNNEDCNVSPVNAEELELLGESTLVNEGSEVDERDFQPIANHKEDKRIFFAVSPEPVPTAGEGVHEKKANNAIAMATPTSSSSSSTFVAKPVDTPRTETPNNLLPEELADNVILESLVKKRKLESISNSSGGLVKVSLLSPRFTAKVSNAGSKALADMFEAMIGAIYIDSGCDLDVVKDVLLFLNILPQLKEEAHHHHHYHHHGGQGGSGGQGSSHHAGHHKSNKRENRESLLSHGYAGHTPRQLWQSPR